MSRADAPYIPYTAAKQGGNHGQNASRSLDRVKMTTKSREELALGIKVPDTRESS